MVLEEIWKDIDGYEGYYQISNIGRVKSLSRPVFKKDGSFHRFKKENIKVPKNTKDGYLSITLSVNGNDRTFLIHRLVAEAFITKPETDEILEVNHIDMNRKNNMVGNLEWATHQDNIKYSSDKGKYLCHDGSNNGRSKPVCVYDLSNNPIKKFLYIRECASWMIDNLYCRGTKVDAVVSGIRKSMDNNKPYYNFIIKFI